MKPQPATGKLLHQESVTSQPYKPLDVRSTEMNPVDSNKLVIHNESGVVQSITDNMGSSDMDNQHERERNLTEIER